MCLWCRDKPSARATCSSSWSLESNLPPPTSVDGSCDAVLLLPCDCWMQSPIVRTKAGLPACCAAAVAAHYFLLGSPSPPPHPHSLAAFEASQRLERSRGSPASPLSSKKTILFINIPSVFSPPPHLLWFPPFFAVLFCSGGTR